MRIVIGEDQALMREGLRLVLERAGFEIVAVAVDAPQLERLVLEHAPELVVADVAPPGDVPRDTPRDTPRTRDAGRRTPPRATVRLVATPRPTVAALRRGLTVKLRSSAAGRVTVTLALGRRTVARGAARARRAGLVTVRLGKVGARAGARLRGRRLTLTVRAGSARASTTVRVR